MIEQGQKSTGQFLHMVNASATRKSQINRYIVLLAMLAPTGQCAICEVNVFDRLVLRSSLS